MRIAFFVNAFPLISEVFIANAAAALAESGHQVDIFGFGNAKSLTPAAEGARPLPAAITVRNAAWPSNPVFRALGAMAPLMHVARRHGFARLPILRPLTYRRSLADLSAIYQADILPEGGRYDILHCQFATLAEFVLKHRAAGLIAGPLVVHFRGYDISEVVRARGPRAYDWLWARADAFVANSDFIRNRAAAIGCPEDRIHVVGSGIRIAEFPFRPPEALVDGEALRLLFVGRLIERKGAHVAIAALGALAREGLRFHLDIVGDGPERARLEALAGAADPNLVIVFHGARPHREIRPLLDAAHLFLAPSLTSTDGGFDGPVNTIKEAMATGVPVIGTRHGGIPELVEEPRTGWLAEEGSAPSLAAAIARALEARAEWRPVAESARAQVAARYAAETVNAQMLDVYRQAGANAGAAVRARARRVPQEFKPEVES